MKPLWLVQKVPTRRSALLIEPFNFIALIERMRAEIQNVRYQKEKGSHEAKGSWRPVFWFDVDQQTFDQFFNSPFGYRGQFLAGPAIGQKANSQVLDALANPLIQSASLKNSESAHVHQSLLSEHAKIWIDEDQDTPRTPELIVQLIVPAWVAASTDIYRRLKRHDATLTNKEIDRIYGVRAPTGSTLKVMGAWISSDGSLHSVASKLNRAEEIHAYGVS